MSNKKRKFSNNPSYEPAKKRRELKAKTYNQQILIDTILREKITFITGPSGAGKTMLSSVLAAQALMDGKYERIIITRPLIESNGKNKNTFGALPGGVDEKIAPFLVPLLDELAYYLTRDEIRDLRNNSRFNRAGERSIEVVPLDFMRGRSFHSCFIICDEAQNANFEQLKMLLTRFGQDSKMVINGDEKQSDLFYADRGALTKCINKLRHVRGVGIVQMTEEDIVREAIIGDILNALEDNHIGNGVYKGRW